MGKMGVGGRKMTLCAQMKADPRTGIKEAKKGEKTKHDYFPNKTLKEGNKKIL